MNQAVKGAATGAAFGGAIWLTTGIWQFFAVTMIGVVCAWLFSPPSRPQPRRRVHEFVRVEIRDIERLAACYEYGGCQWTGDGCSAKPRILGNYAIHKGCVHNAPAGKRVPDHRDDCTEEGCKGECYQVK